MVTRESTLRESFDPSAFHRAASMAQTGWAEREARATSKRRVQDTLTRFSGTITFLVGTLTALVVRPPDVMDGRDVVVSGIALMASLVIGMVGSRIAASVFRTTAVEVDRVVMWAVALVAALAIAATGSVTDFARDADDYLADVPGFTLTTPADLDTFNLVRESHDVFSDAGMWALETNDNVVGAVGIYLIEDGKVRGDLKMMSHAISGGSLEPRRGMLSGQSVLVAGGGANVQLGWIDGSALVVVSGARRSEIEPAAAALLNARD